MKKILVPFDFSGASFNAVHHAIRMAQQTEAEITFLWSRRFPAMEDDDEPGPDEECFPNQQPVLWWQLLQNMLKALCVNEKPTRIHYLFKESLEGKSLAAVLQGNTYDLLVIGIEESEGQTSLPWEWWMHISTPVLVVPQQAPSQVVGTISLVIDSRYMQEKQALAILFDLTKAFGAHLQIIYREGPQREAYSFRQAMKQLGLAPRLDVIRHTYQFVQPFRQPELEEMVNQCNTHWLVLFQPHQPTRAEMEALQHQITQSRLPLLLLPFTEAVVYRAAPSAAIRERAAFADVC